MLEQIVQSARLLQPETTLLVSFCVILLLGVIVPRGGRNFGWLALIGLAATGYALSRQAAGAPTGAFSNMLAVDSFALFFKSLILVAAAFVVVFSMHSAELKTGRRSLGEYFALIFGMTLGMFFMVGSSNLLMMYISL